MCCGRCTRVVNADAYSIFVTGLKDLEAQTDSWCTMLGGALETMSGQIRCFLCCGLFFTLGEKHISLIIRFLLHRSS